MMMMKTEDFVDE